MRKGIKLNSSAGIRVPCLTCNERYAECHKNCNKYKLYRTILDCLRHKRDENFEETNFMRDVRRKIIKKNMKKAKENHMNRKI